jgi:DNA modification methylase
LNLGDSFAGSNKGQYADGSAVDRGEAKQGTNMGSVTGGMTVGNFGCKPKDLLGIPYRVALALRDDGWYWRAIIPWVKQSAMPSSTLDRPTIGTEYWLMFAKSPRYYYDQFAVLQPFADQRQGADGSGKKRVRNVGGRTDGYTTPNGVYPEQNGGRFRRDTDWFRESLQIIQETGEGALLDEDGDILAMHFNPGNARWEYCKHCDTLYHSKQVKYIKHYKDAQNVVHDICYNCGKTDGWVKHYAAYPLEMIEPLIRACTSEYGVCSICNAPWTRIIEKNGIKGQRKAAHVPEHDATKLSSTGWQPTMRAGDAWLPSCNCFTYANGDPEQDDHTMIPLPTVPSVILDPFSGTGTTGIAALMHGRNYIGCELGADYAMASSARLRAVGQPSLDVLPGQLALEGI